MIFKNIEIKLRSRSKGLSDHLRILCLILHNITQPSVKLFLTKSPNSVRRPTTEHTQQYITNNIHEHRASHTRTNPRIQNELGMQHSTFNPHSTPAPTPSHHIPSQKPVGDTPAPKVKPPRADTKAAAGKKQTLSKDLTSTRTNRCPAAGTDEAKKRTLKASYARCKDDVARTRFLEKHNLKAEDMESSKKNTPAPPSQKKRSTKTNKVSAKIDSNQQLRGFPEHQPSDELHYLVRALEEYSTQDPETQRRRAILYSRINAPIVQNQIHATIDYYLGRGRPHTFILIARVQNVEKTTDDVALGDYNGFTIMNIAELNGLQALQTTHEILTTIRHNADAVRCELQYLVASEKHENGRRLSVLLPNAMLSSLPPCHISRAEILGQGHSISLDTGTPPYPHPNSSIWLIFLVRDHSTVVVDITDVHAPRYCYLWAREDGVRILAHPPTNLGEDLFDAPIFHKNPEICHWTSRLAEWQLVRPSAIYSAWGFPITPVQTRDLFEIGDNESDFWRRTIRPWGYSNLRHYTTVGPK